MLLFLGSDGVVPIVACSVLIVLVGAGLLFYRTRAMHRLIFVGLYAFVATFGFTAGSIIDVIRYSNQIGGISGGTGYTLAIFFSIPLTYVVSAFVLYVGALIVDKLRVSKDA